MDNLKFSFYTDLNDPLKKELLKFTVKSDSYMHQLLMGQKGKLCVAVIAMLDDKIIGWGAEILRDDSVYTNIFVDPNFRCQGIGTAIFEKINEKKVSCWDYISYRFWGVTTMLPKGQNLNATK